MMDKLGSVASSAAGKKAESLMSGDNSPVNNIPSPDNLPEQTGMPVDNPTESTSMAPGYNSFADKRAIAQGKDPSTSPNGQEENSTKKVLSAVGKGAATYFGGAEGAEKSSDIINSEAGQKVLDKASETIDKVPGVSEAAKAIDDSGAADVVNGGVDAFAKAKKGDLKGAKDSLKQAKGGMKKNKKMQKLKLIMALGPLAFIFLIIIVIVSAEGGGFLNVTDGTFSDKGMIVSDDPSNPDDPTNPDDPDNPIPPGGHYSPAQLSALVSFATSKIGIVQGSDDWKKINTNIGSPHKEAWCADFVSWALKSSGMGFYNSASCSSWRNYAKNHNMWSEGGYAYTPKTGDLVIFDWDPNDGIETNHIGIVISNNGNTITTVEGNTSPPGGSGSGVYQKTRNKSLIRGYIVL